MEGWCIWSPFVFMALGFQTPFNKMIKTDLQKDFEYQSHKAAVARLEKQLREAKDKQYYSSSLQARATIDTYVIPTADAITSWFTEAKEGRARTTATVCVADDMLGWMEFVKPEVIAAITLKSVFDLHGVYDRMTVAKAANFVGTRIEDEARFRYYELVSPADVVERMKRRASEAGSSPSYRRISTKSITEKILVNDHEFDPSNTVLSKVLYNVHTADAAMFQAVVGSNDSPDYSAVATEANVECVKLNPLAEPNVVT